MSENRDRSFYILHLGGRQKQACRFIMFSVLECAGVDLPPGQRESALMEGGAADAL